MGSNTADGVIVAGHLTVTPADRDSYVAGCHDVVRQARAAPGCLDFAVSPDVLDPSRINVYERWASRSAVEAFRGDGPDDDQAAAIRSASVVEYYVTAARPLT